MTMADGEAVAPRVRWWDPHEADWWVAVLFAVGSSCFALGAVPGYASLVGVEADDITFAVGSVFFTAAAWMQLLVSVGFTLVWYRLLLGVFGKPERWQQTVTAVLGFGCIITPLIVPAAGMMAPYADDPSAAMPWMLLLLPLAGYLIYVSARILRAAIERPMFQCVMLVLLQTFLEPLILLTLFGADVPAGAAGATGG